MEGTLSPADVAVLSGNRGGNGFGGFGNDGWWIILLFLAFGWGNNGNGGFFGGRNSGASDNYVLASDFATLQRQLDSATNSLERKGDYIQEQICNSDQMNSQLFATVNANLMNGFANTNLGISNNRYENQLAIANAQTGITGAITDIGTQLQSCCCQQRYDALQNTNTLSNQLNDNRYNDLLNTNMLNNSINNGFCNSNYSNATNTRDIIDAVNANGRETRQMINDIRLADKDQEIAQLRTMLNNANLAASQAAQTNSIVDQLRPTPVPSYIVQNPYCNCNGCGNYNF